MPEQLTPSTVFYRNATRYTFVSHYSAKIMLTSLNQNVYEGFELSKY